MQNVLAVHNAISWRRAVFNRPHFPITELQAEYNVIYWYIK